MPRQSLRSVEECYRGREVRVFRLNRDAVIARLRERAHALLESRADVLEVRLFGSLARGEAGPGSDADLFVVMRDGAPSFLDRSVDLARYFSGTGIGCDVIAYTESEARQLPLQSTRFAAAVGAEAIVLARRGAQDDASGRRAERR